MATTNYTNLLTQLETLHTRAISEADNFSVCCKAQDLIQSSNLETFEDLLTKASQSPPILQAGTTLNGIEAALNLLNEVQAMEVAA